MPYNKLIKRRLTLILLLVSMLSSVILGTKAQAMKSKVQESSTEAPFAVASVSRYVPLNKLYEKTQGWVGADGAYSIPLDKDKTLWTYGDTFIGTIKDGKRIKPKMINNTVGVQSIGAKPKMEFYWPGGVKKPKSMWIPGHKKDYYWPADGAFVDGKLFVFLHKIRTNTKLPPPFQFETIGDDLSVISNPKESPLKWTKKKIVLTDDSKTINYATACMVDGDYLYIYSNYPKAKEELNPHPLIVSRITKSDLLKEDLSKMEHYSSDKTWRSDLKDPMVLFIDGAPEMSVGVVRGIKGYVALYMPPLTKTIVVRHSMKPEGPWSKPVKIFDCPEVEDSVILYSAKMHPELVLEDMKPKSLIITYCRNTREFKDHFDKPEIYFPQALLVKLVDK